MPRIIRSLKYLTFITGAAALTLIVIVVGILSTGRRFDIRLLSVSVDQSMSSVSSVTKRSSFATTSQTVSDLTAFRGCRLINSSDQLANVSLNSFRCVPAKTSGMTFPICVYEATEDVWVSKSFIFGGYFEGATVDRFIRLLRRYPDVEFVDLGANIGTFTLPAARVTHVVAVEPYSLSMARLFKSIQLGGVEKNVSLVYDAISDERSTSKLGFYQGNVGGTYLSAVGTDCIGESCTQTVLLDDLLPLMRRRRAVMKVDVEAHQHRVFTDSTAGKFFQLIDVPLIFMEWNGMKCEGQNTRSEVRNLINFFATRQYRVFSVNNQRLEITNCHQWSGNVIFSKESLKF